MKVIQTIPWLVPEAGGPVRSVTRLCSRLVENNVSVHLLALDFSPKYGLPVLPVQQIETTFVKVGIAVGLNAIWAPRFGNELRKLCVQKQDTIIHDHGLWLITNHITASFADRNKIPLILSVRGMLEPWARQNSFLRKQLAWHLYQRHDLKKPTVLHATSPEEAENLRQLRLTQPIAMIPNGVDLPTNHCQYPSGRKSDKYTLLFLSRIHPKKGLLNLINALAAVLPTDWQVIIAGPDENNHQHEVEAAVQASGLQNQITFIGPVDDSQKWQVYQQADLFVLPTFSENFGTVVAEALAAGVPVITTKGAPWYELETHNCGWWVDMGVEPLAQALKTAMNLTDQQRIQMGQNGRKLVEQNYSWSDAATRMSLVYQWMLGQGSKPDCVYK